MIKKLSSLAISLIITLTLAAQERFEPELSFGVNGGVNLSRVSFSPKIPQDLLLQATGGLSLRYITEKHWGLQAELNYSLRGWQETRDTLINRNIYARSLAYVELPLMTHLYFDVHKQFRVVVFAGPQLSYLLDEKELERELDETIVRPYYYDNSLQRSFEYGIMGGLGVEWRTGIGSFVLDGRFYHSLRDIFDNSRSDNFQKSLNMVFGIKLTYLFQK